MSRCRRCLLLPVFSLLFFTLYCAKISAPPGGPIDKTPPTILATTPPLDSIHVAKAKKISIRFSEDINQTTTDGAIFISPRFEDEIKYKWKGKTLNINLPDSFADSTTYIVNIGATVSDLHGNKMDQSYILAFSTGDKIDQGRLTGTVYDSRKPYPDASIGLYKFLQPDSSTRFDSIYPPYLTQSGKSGEYGFQYIPEGKFFVLAFIDKNKNQIFDYPQESFGLPDRIANITPDENAPGINFYLQKDDTASVEILSITMTSERLLKVRFSSAVASDSLRENKSKIYLESVETDKPLLYPVAINLPPGIKSPNYLFYFEDVSNGTYRLYIDADILGRHPDSVTTVQSEKFSVADDTDETIPAVDSITHKNQTIYPSDSLIQIFFSEPINRQSYENAFQLTDADSNSYALKFRQPDRFSLDIYALDLKWNMKYTMTIAESLIVDLSGNRLGDSISSFNFSTYDQDSLGSISGTITLKSTVDTTASPYIRFVSENNKFVFERRVLSGHFDFPLPPGKYLLGGYLDANNNGRFDMGTLFPFHYSETTTYYPDTIRVRSRFETAGIDLIFE